ncbi:MAG TPA: ribonuclease J, partial [Actinomycetota bacterium]|nr:ribonuclease J [Actinomycetota bacterium]
MPGSSEPILPSPPEAFRRPDGPARVVFLGGVGEVGRNMACVELDGRLLIVDVGLSFPHAEMPGIDLVLPDFEYVRGRLDD